MPASEWNSDRTKPSIPLIMNLTDRILLLSLQKKKIITHLYTTPENKEFEEKNVYTQ